MGETTQAGGAGWEGAPFWVRAVQPAQEPLSRMQVLIPESFQGREGGRGAPAQPSSLPSRGQHSQREPLR